jgi:hypothetical protein
VLSEDAISFLKGLIEIDPEKRLSAQDAFNH